MTGSKGSWPNLVLDIRGALRNLVPLVQLKKREASNFTKINAPPWVFFTFLKLYKWYQIAQRITYSI